MKKIIVLLICLVCIFKVYAQKTYIVKVKIHNPNHFTFFLAYFANGGYVRDTNHVVENGTVLFKGKVDEPVVAILYLRRNPATTIFIPGAMCTFFLTNNIINIIGDADSFYRAIVSGGKPNLEWNKIKEKENQLIGEGLRVQKTVGNFKVGDDSAILKRAEKLYTINVEKQEKLRKQFITNNPNSIVSIYFLSTLLNSMNLTQLKAFYAKLGKPLRSSYGKDVFDKIKGLEATSEGKEAIPIDKMDINGNQINLKALQGKYVLIDFWGTWCGECLRGFPHLKELYAKYKDKGYEILGIAFELRSNLEEDMRVWKEVIKKYDLPWLQVLNNEGMQKFDAVKAYGVTAYPTKILLDKEGRVIGRYVDEDEKLDNKLKEIFGG